MTSRIAKARDAYVTGLIEVDELERRIGLALEHDPDDPGEHTRYSDAPGYAWPDGSTGHKVPHAQHLANMTAALKERWTNQERRLAELDRTLDEQKRALSRL